VLVTVVDPATVVHTCIPPIVKPVAVLPVKEIPNLHTEQAFSSHAPDILNMIE
jgi:hypothetical protein